MVIRNTPKDISKYILVTDDKIIFQLSEKGIFPIYIDNKTAYFKKQQLTEATTYTWYYKWYYITGGIRHWKN